MAPPADSPPAPLRLAAIAGGETAPARPAEAGAARPQAEVARAEARPAADSGTTPPAAGADAAPASGAPRPEPAPAPQAAPGPDAKVEAKPAPRPEARPDPKAAEPKPGGEAKPAPGPENRAEPKPEAKPAPKPEAKADPKAEAKPAPEPKPEAKPAPKPEAKPEPRPEAKPAPKSERKPEAKPAPKPEAKPEPRPESKPAPPPQAGAARLERRHIVLGASFLALVFVPLIVTTAYLFGWAQDQYASRVGFAVRNEEMTSASSLLGGLMGFTSSGGGDSDILYRYIQSQDMVQKVDARLDLHRIYAAHADIDPVFALARETSAEDLLAYWNRMVKVFYDNRTGLIEVRVNAFAPGDAQAIAGAILDESTATINALSAIAREDATRYAREELALAQDRLRDARLAVADFRTRNQMVDPTADVAGQMTLLGTLQGQLAAALIEQDMLRETGARAEDPRVTQIARRIGVIEERIRGERAKIAGAPGADPATAAPRDYASAVGDFERLRVEQEFAERSYVAALATYDAARAEAQRKSRYLATYIQPTQAETAEYPRRYLIVAMTLVFLLLAWSVVALVYYAIRDRR